MRRREIARMRFTLVLNKQADIVAELSSWQAQLSAVFRNVAMDEIVKNRRGMVAFEESRSTLAELDEGTIYDAGVSLEDDLMSDAERVHVLQQFTRPAVRLAFLRKVYGLVTLQLVATGSIIFALRTSPALLAGIVHQLGGALPLLPLLPLLLLACSGAARSGGPPARWSSRPLRR